MIGTVCDDGFGTKEGIAICKYLGYPFIREYSANVNVGYPFKGDVLMDRLKCNGTDYKECQYMKKKTSCNHDEDIWIDCETNDYIGTYPIERKSISISNFIQLLFKLSGAAGVISHRVAQHVAMPLCKGDEFVVQSRSMDGAQVYRMILAAVEIA